MNLSKKLIGIGAIVDSAVERAVPKRITWILAWPVLSFMGAIEPETFKYIGSGTYELYDDTSVRDVGRAEGLVSVLPVVAGIVMWGMIGTEPTAFNLTAMLVSVVYMFSTLHVVNNVEILLVGENDG